MKFYDNGGSPINTFDKNKPYWYVKGRKWTTRSNNSLQKALESWIEDITNTWGDTAIEVGSHGV